MLDNPRITIGIQITVALGSVTFRDPGKFGLRARRDGIGIHPGAGTSASLIIPFGHAPYAWKGSRTESSTPNLSGRNLLIGCMQTEKGLLLADRSSLKNYLRILTFGIC